MEPFARLLLRRCASVLKGFSPSAKLLMPTMPTESSVHREPVLRVNEMNKIVRTLVLLSPILSLLGCEEQRPVSYSEDVRPFLDKYCMRCHGEGGKGSEASGLRMDNYESLMKGTVHGPVVKPGDSFTSALVMLMEGRADPSLRMPHDLRNMPTKAEIEMVKAWIDQGAKNN